MSMNLAVSGPEHLPASADVDQTHQGNRRLPSDVIRYGPLIQFHLDQVKLDDKGVARPVQVLKNRRSHLRKWVEFNERDMDSPVGEELGARYTYTLIKFLAHLEASGYTEQTIDDRKSAVQQLRESYAQKVKGDNLPPEFSAELCALMKLSNRTVADVARRAKLSYNCVRTWVIGKKIPKFSSLAPIRRLEDYFGVAPNTLSSRLPDAHGTTD
jgi:hypothetical protein